MMEAEEDMEEVGEWSSALGASKEDRRARRARRFFWLENPKTMSVGRRA